MWLYIAVAHEHIHINHVSVGVGVHSQTHDIVLCMYLERQCMHSLACSPAHAKAA